MAEIRKHKPSAGQSAIAQALEKAMGAPVRPVAPGAAPKPVENPDIEPPTRPGIGVTTSTAAPASFLTASPSALRHPSPSATPRRDTDSSAPGADD